MRLSRTALACLLALAIPASFSCRSSRFTTTTTDRLDRLVSGLHERGLFDGAVVVGDEAGVIWAKGFGFANAAAGVPFTPDTPSDSASLAKTFTSALVIQLDHEGTLDLDAPVQQWLPELPYPAITLRHLLSHSSALPFVDYGEFDALLPPDQVRTTEVLLGVIAAQQRPLTLQPGTAFEYNSLGFDLAALAASRAAGKPFGALLEERFFEPLGITSAFLRPGRLSEFPGTRTVGYRRRDGALELHEVFDHEAFHGGSNIYISALDLHRWNAAFLGESPLSKEARDASLRPARVGGHPSGVTLGSWYSTGRAFSYSGHLQGFHSEVYRDVRAGRSIVYVSNNTIEPWVQHGLVRSINAILDGDESDLEQPATDDVAEDERPSLAGEWKYGSGEVLTIESRGTALNALRGGVRCQIFPVSPRAFYVPGFDLMLGFSKDNSGSFSRMHVSSNFEAQWATRQ